MTRCKVCGRALRNPESVAKGMGPLCERRLIGIARNMTIAKRASGPTALPECVGLIEKGDGENGQD